LKLEDKSYESSYYIIFLLIFVGFVMQNRPQYHPSRGEQLANSILANTAKIIKDQYLLQPCGEGAAMPGGPIQELTLCFDTKHPYTKEQLRKLLILASNELLQKVGNNNEIQEFIKKKPFTIKNIEIVIYNHDREGRSVNDPVISVAEISQMKLVYRTIDPQNSFKYKNRFEERYEEALKAINKSENISLTPPPQRTAAADTVEAVAVDAPEVVLESALPTEEQS